MSDKVETKPLKKRFLKGIGWRLIGDIGGYLLQIGFVAVMARYLTLYEFGVMTAAMIAYRLLNMFSSISVGNTVYQAKEISGGQISALFYVQLAVFSIVSTVGFFVAPWVGWFFENPEVRQMFQFTVWILVLEGLLFPQVMMVKELRFDRLVKLQLFSQVFGCSVGIVAAIYGFGVWSLVVRLFSGKSVMIIGVWFGAGWSPSKPEFKKTMEHYLFGLNLLGSRILTFVSQNSAHLILGKVFGMAVLGSFNIAYNLAILPASRIQGGLVTVLIPAAAKLTDENSKKNYFVGLFLLSFFFAPVMLGFASIAIPLIEVVYGPDYAPVAKMLPFLAVAGYFRGVSALIRGFLISGGDSKSLLRISVVEAILSIPLLLFACNFGGIEAVLVVYALIACMAFALFVRARKKQANQTTSSVNKCIKSVAIASCMGVLVYFVTLAIPSSLVGLITGISLGAVFYIVAWLILMTEKDYLYLLEVPFLRRLLQPLVKPQKNEA